MADLEVRRPVALRTVPGVELAAVGTWAASTGVTTFTPEDLANAVAALECPGVRNPVIKLGHDEPDSTSGIRWDGEPAVGWIANMHMDGPKLVGDYAGMPAWLTQTDDETGMAVLATAYPDRSIEIRRPFVCQIGHTHPSVITAVALLGVYAPGVGVLKSMQDVYAAFTEPMSADLAATSARAMLSTTVRVAALRAPTPQEIAAGVDFAAAQEDWQGALDDLLEKWPDISEAQRAELAAQVEAAVEDNPDALGTLTVATGAAAALLLPAMADVASLAMSAALAEAASQGVRIPAPGVDDGELAAMADAIAAAMGASTASMAGRTAAQALGTGSGRDIAAHTSEQLAGLTDRFLRDQLGGALSAAQAAGRFRVFEVAPIAEYYASEQLDTATCEKCREIDGEKFDTLAEAREAYGSGKYVDCLGRERCRGQVFATWGTAARAGSSISTTIRTGGAMPDAPGGTSTVKASVSVEDISRQYYESAGYSMWITAMHVDPLELIAADDATGKFFRVPVELSGEAFTFGEPSEVAINYVPVTAASAVKNPARWTNRAASLSAAGLPNAEVPATKTEPGKAPDGGAAIRKLASATKTPEADAPGDTATPEEEALSVDKAKIKEGLGLAADASDEEMQQALAALASPSTPPTVTAPTTDDPAALLAAIPKGAKAIVLDSDNYRALVERADLGAKAHEEVKHMQRDAFLKQAVRDNRFPVSKLSDYERMWDANPDAAKSFIELMPKNAIPTGQVGFLGAEVDKNESDLAYDAYMGKAV